MTIRNPPVSEIGAAVQAASHRKLATGFIRSPGLISTADLQVSGDPSTMNAIFTAGAAYLKLPDGTYDTFDSNATEGRSINPNPSGGTRTDLAYIGMKSKEFGDLENSLNLYVKTNPTTGTGTPPPVDSMAATYTLAEIDVPVGATRGSQCTFRNKSATTAPVRDGGYGAGDITLPVQPYAAWHRSGVGSGGFVSAYNAAPFVPRAVICQGTYPDIDSGGPAFFVPSGVFGYGHYEGHWFKADGTAMTNPAGIGYIEWYALLIPGPAFSYAAGGISPATS